MSRKGVLYSLVRLDNGKFVNFYNTHLQAYIEDDSVRNNQLKTLEFALEKNDNGYPNIIVGDFNIIAHTDEYKDFKNRFPLLFDTWEQLRPSDNGYTWDQETNYYARKYSEREDPPSQRLDYILYSHGLNQQITPTSINVLNDKSELLSDHYAVTGTLEIN
jgi:endonuclease/exonuclease/phosphatase family metal-dependent hydrolase